LFEFVDASEKIEGLVQKVEKKRDKIVHRFRFMNQVPLNDTHPDCLVNFLEYWEIKGDQIRHWSWVTDFTLNENNVMQIMKAGRARWSIENETFNTLKNQGYEFEHNFGHGKANLSVVLAMLMMLAFLIDQVQELSCHLFQKAKERLESRTRLWHVMRSFFEQFKFNNWEEFLSALAFGIKTQFEIQYDTS
jgi:hypothetical protein